MSETKQDGRPTLVLGGRGKTGRRVVERLEAGGVPVRVGSRSGQPAFDWDDDTTWAPVLRGAGAAYIAYYPDIAMPGAGETVRSFAEQAIEHGVERLVLLTGRGEEAAQQAERDVQDTGADVTILRCAWFMQNFSESFLLDSVLGDEVFLPAGAQLDPFVDAEDIADVAVAALTEPGHAGQVYELTSPRLLTFADAVGEIARAAGRPIRYVQVSLEDYAAGAAAQGIPAEVVGFLTYLFGEILGNSPYVTDGVERALGRPARDFAAYAAATAASGVWTPTVAATGR
jgi:uncharacterized protein YbjT (DUF2867 family)